jgi:hypothetical protein
MTSIETKDTPPLNFTAEEAALWQREVNQRNSIPVQPASKEEAEKHREDPSTYNYSYFLRDLDAATKSTSALVDVLGLNSVDPELEEALRTTLSSTLWEIDNEKSTVVGIVVDAIHGLLSRHSYFSRFVYGVPRRYPRRIAEIEAEIESGKPFALSQLHDELHLAKAMEAAANVKTTEAIV